MKALVVVSFGSSVEAARETIESVERAMAKARQDWDFFRAYTSSFLVRKCKEQGYEISSPGDVLRTLCKLGYQQVHLQPTHVIPGQEYDKLTALCKEYEDHFESLTLGHPLIYTGEELMEVAQALIRNWGPENEECLLLMGHGTTHPANFIYPAMDTAFRLLDKERIFMATVEGWPDLLQVIPKLKKSGKRKVKIAPFLLVAGEHVRNDMAGEEPHSWQHILEDQGFEVSCVLQGIGTIPDILELYGKRCKNQFEP